MPACFHIASNRPPPAALLAVALGPTLGSVSSSVINVALPTISHDFQVAPSAAIWVVNASQLATTAMLLFLASLGDARGARRVYLGGGILFTLTAAGCALAPNLAALVALRALQGLGNAALIVTTPTLARALFPPAQLGRAVAINAMCVAFGTAVGPTLGGLILSVAPWQWIFGLSVPIGVLAVVLGWRALPRVVPHGGPVDGWSAVLSAVGLAALAYAFDGLARREAIGAALAAAAIGALALGLFIGRQRRIAHPLLAMELFADRIFSVAALASAATYFAQGISYVALPFFFQSVLGRTPLVTGLLMSAWPITTLIVAAQMGRLSDRYAAPALCTLGIVVMGGGLAGFALLPTVPPSWAIVVCAGVAGAGFAIFQTPNNRAMIGAAPPEKTGRASGIMSVTRYIGQTSGAVSASLVFALAGTAAAGLGRNAIEVALLCACGTIALAGAASAFRMHHA